LTGNLVGFAVEHAETRPAKEDGMPDPDRHVHIVLFNLTYDSVEREWKAVKFRPIMDDRKFFDRCFDLRFSHKLAELGYGIETKYKTDGKGGKRYYSWDIANMPASVVAKFSRRSSESRETGRRSRHRRSPVQRQAWRYLPLEQAKGPNPGGLPDVLGPESGSRGGAADRRVCSRRRWAMRTPRWRNTAEKAVPSPSPTTSSETRWSAGTIWQ